MFLSELIINYRQWIGSFRKIAICCVSSIVCYKMKLHEDSIFKNANQFSYPMPYLQQLPSLSKFTYFGITQHTDFIWLPWKIIIHHVECEIGQICHTLPQSPKYHLLMFHVCFLIHFQMKKRNILVSKWRLTEILNYCSVYHWEIISNIQSIWN